MVFIEIIKDKKKFVRMLVAVVVALIFGYLMIKVRHMVFAPINVIKKAIQNEDIETVAEYYDKLESVSDRELVEDTMYDYVFDLSQKYINKEIEYETLDTNIRLLNDILNSNEDYAELVNYAEMLHESRENSRMGDEMMASGNYYDAMKYYQMVNILDPDAEKSVSNCNVCVERLLVGQWKVSGYLENIITSENENLYDISYPVFLYLVFEDDNTGYIEINEQSTDNVSTLTAFEYYVDGNTLVIEYSSVTAKYTYGIDDELGVLKIYSPDTSEYLTNLDVSFPSLLEK